MQMWAHMPYTCKKSRRYRPEGHVVLRDVIGCLPQGPPRLPEHIDFRRQPKHCECVLQQKVEKESESVPAHGAAARISASDPGIRPEGFSSGVFRHTPDLLSTDPYGSFQKSRAQIDISQIVVLVL